jgi:hypothetical protein
MFGLFDKKRQPLLATMIFDEAYCHSAGNAAARTYIIAKGTTDLRFVIPNFEAFWQTYINQNENLTDETLIALRDGKAVFTISVVDGGEYYHHDGVADDGSVVLNADNLEGADPQKPFAGFLNGVLALGLYHIGEFRFEVLWATLYAS